VEIKTKYIFLRFLFVFVLAKKFIEPAKRKERGKRSRDGPKFLPPEINEIVGALFAEFFPRPHFAFVDIVK
jgi:hypothetical protein